MCVRLALFLGLSFIFLWFAGKQKAAGQKSAQAPVVLLSPKEGAKVGQVEKIVGRLNNKGWPIVLVKPLVGGEPWYVQSPVEQLKEGKFITPAAFGGAQTEADTRFSLVIVVAKSKREAFKLKGAILRELPPGLPQSKSVTVVRTSGNLSYVRWIRFAGSSWKVKRGRKAGPGPNDFSDTYENVRVDDKGYLHLAITEAGGRWQCAEVVAERSLGYGEYRWVISGELPTLDPNVSLGLFTYETDTREIDFELARWGDAKNANAQFVVQPSDDKKSMHRFDAGQAKVLTCHLLWQKGLVHGRCWTGKDVTQRPLADWRYTGSRIPPPGNERARANLWLFKGKPPSRGVTRQEVVIRSFSFQPLPDNNEPRK